MEPCFLTAAEAMAQIRDKTLTSETLVRSCLERIAQRDADVRAWAYVDPVRASAQQRVPAGADQAGPDVVDDPRPQAADGHQRTTAVAGLRAPEPAWRRQPRLARRADAARGPRAGRAGAAELPARRGLHQRRH